MPCSRLLCTQNLESPHLSSLITFLRSPGSKLPRTKPGMCCVIRNQARPKTPRPRSHALNTKPAGRFSTSSHRPRSRDSSAPGQMLSSCSSRFTARPPAWTSSDPTSAPPSPTFSSRAATRTRWVILVRFWPVGEKVFLWKGGGMASECFPRILWRRVQSPSALSVVMAHKPRPLLEAPKAPKAQATHRRDDSDRIEAIFKTS